MIVPRPRKNCAQVAASFSQALAILTIGLSLGCNGMPKNRGDDFVKPLATASASLQHFRQELPDERTLCMETAKTVAEKGHAEEAIKLYQKAEELGSSQAPLDKQLAPLHAQAGQFDAAIERYERLALSSPQDVELCNNFAWTLMEAQRYDGAISEAQRGLTIEANHKRLQTTLAMIHYRQGNRTAAWDQFAKAQDSNTAHHNIAVLDIDAGSLQSAHDHLRQVGYTTTEGRSKVNPKTKTLLAAFNQQDIDQDKSLQ